MTTNSTLSANPFLPPAITDGAENPPLESVGLYVVSPRKFFILFMGTLGIYSLYWMYRNWNELRKSGRAKVLPFIRSIFCLFFMHALMRHVTTIQRERVIERGDANRRLATAAVIGLIVQSLGQKIFTRLPFGPVGSLFDFTMCAVTGMLFWSMQRSINLASGDINGESNHHLTTANIIWLLIGGLLWAISLLMIFGPMLTPYWYHSIVNQFSSKR